MIEHKLPYAEVTVGMYGSCCGGPRVIPNRCPDTPALRHPGSPALSLVHKADVPEIMNIYQWGLAPSDLHRVTE